MLDVSRALWNPDRMKSFRDCKFLPSSEEGGVKCEAQQYGQARTICSLQCIFMSQPAFPLVMQSADIDMCVIHPIP